MLITVLKSMAIGELRIAVVKLSTRHRGIDLRRQNPAALIRKRLVARLGSGHGPSLLRLQLSLPPR